MSTIHRLPLDPLLDLLRLTPGPSNGTTPGYATTLATVAEVSPRQVHRWVQAGGIPLHTADRICCTLGTHLAIVWPEIYAEVAA